MRRAIVTAVTGCFLSTSAALSQAPVVQEWQDRIEACRRAHPLVQGQASALVSCQARVNVAHAVRVGGRDVDLMRLAAARSLAAAEAFDQGRITQAQFQLAVAEAEHAFVQEVAARDRQAAGAAAAAAAQSQALIAGGLAIMGQAAGGGSHIPDPPAPLTTSCRRYGGMVQCSTR